MKRLLFAAWLMVGCGGLSREDFAQQVAGTRACNQATDRCVMAGATQCLCPTPVNASFAAQINTVAMDVACGSTVAQCPTVVNPRCAEGSCVADTLR